MLKSLPAACTAAFLASPASALEVLRDRSTLGFEVSVGERRLAGTFADWYAEIDLDAGMIRVMVDVTSASLGDPLLDAVMHGADWLGSGDAPEASFVSDTIRTQEDGHVADGTLTVKGIDVPLAVTIRGTRPDPASYDVSAPIDRLAIGVGSENSPVVQFVEIVGRIKVRE